MDNLSRDEISVNKLAAMWEETDESKKRYAVCLPCEAFTYETKMCKECGCFMPRKVTVVEANCPLNKW